ncbi:MAG: hypothetical protein Q8N88_05755 [Nanoarchaeota archaeon]|nr:hypothetical protein [Nanoarchaeota archaeon]
MRGLKEFVDNEARLTSELKRAFRSGRRLPEGYYHMLTALTAPYLNSNYRTEQQQNPRK